MAPECVAATDRITQHVSTLSHIDATVWQEKHKAGKKEILIEQDKR